MAAVRHLDIFLTLYGCALRILNERHALVSQNRDFLGHLAIDYMRQTIGFDYSPTDIQKLTPVVVIY